jgi:hypothetical protein
MHATLRIPLASYAVFTLALLAAAIAAPLLAPSGECPLDGDPPSRSERAPRDFPSIEIDSRTHFVPSIKNGAVRGIRVFGAQHTLGLRALGLKSGDVLDRINDESLSGALRASDIDRALMLLLDPRASIDVVGTRDGAPFRVRRVGERVDP